MLEYSKNLGGILMKNTTLCYIEKDGAYLMLHRIKKVNDENRDKWVGIGGKFEDGESPFDCVRREIYEEIGLTPISLSYRGIVTFVSDVYGTEYMHLFTCKEFFGTARLDCDEGVPEWVKIENGEKLLPIEIKSGQTVASSMFSGLDYWQKLSQCEGGMLIYGGEESYTRKGMMVRSWQEI